MVPPYFANSLAGFDEQAEKNVGWNPRSGFHHVKQLRKLWWNHQKERALFDGSTLRWFHPTDLPQPNFNPTIPVHTVIRQSQR